MKKRVLSILAGALALTLTSCGQNGTSKNDNTGAAVETQEAKHKIGVLVYDITDEEVMSFRDYLEGYIAPAFGDVEFEYSESITSPEEELDFIARSGESGAEGILSFLSYDLKAETEECEKNGIYYLMASGTVPEEQFLSVKENPYFLGVIGPGEEMEYQAAREMAEYFTGAGDRGKSWFIMSGGAPIGNEMHKLRTIAILDELQESFGVTFSQSSEDLALSPEPVTLEAGDLTVCIAPGYLAIESFLESVRAEYRKGSFDTVLAVLPLDEMAAEIAETDAKVGTVDCYSVRNLQLFGEGHLDYVAGKYGSMIGPSFALMYNAVTGYAEDFRDGGEALSINQGFWSSADLDDFTEKYTFASSRELNAYNYEDLYSLCRVYNEEADVNALKALAGAYSYEEAARRRETDREAGDKV